MSDPTITVLMAVYNGGDYLKAAVESVLRQTFDDFEFLIINDCSRDNSVETITSFNDPRIRLVNNESNLGQTRSLNKELGLAKGPLYRQDGCRRCGVAELARKNFCVFAITAIVRRRQL